ncbi:MAG TPA: DoxX family protein [Flavobacteriaceae bacterium]|nr:DoxX family protein [Flavobacteriaceae bacterium]MCB9211987.1 DoxX family protein [Alteromonas sp.]HPF09919.1 DoxX family protein [Flavobacteriaceae bacterium]HQU20016.1 DoxX family protein [Flavobacteriaceae bacterium]HQU63998.1 DoxX family protein [Flavobacteriaceae bacterium]
MKLFHTILYIGLGLMLLLFGFNKFIWFLQDFDFSGYPEAEHLFKTLRYSSHDEGPKGYLMHFVGGTEILVGLLLVLRKWVPFALVVLVPISLNLVAFHLFVNLPNIGPALLVALVNGYLIYKNWNAYKPLFRQKT